MDIQGQWSQIDAFQMDIFSWLNDIPIQRKLFFQDSEGTNASTEIKYTLYVWRLGLTQWSINSFEFKFEDTRLSS